MSHELYIQQLTSFKEKERPEAVLFVADDPQLIKIIVAWTNTRVKTVEEVYPLTGESEGDIWDWLWDNTVFSKEELITKSAVLRSGFDWKMRPLIGNRILYPDGSVNSFVHRYLRDRVIRLFDKNGKTTRRPRRE